MFGFRNLFKSVKKRGLSDPWHWLARAVSSTSSGANVNADTSLQVSAVYACVKRISESIASLPLMVYRRTESGKEIAKNHWLSPLLHNAPNSFQTSYEWREGLMANINLRGNSYCQKVMTGGGKIKELLPLNPANMEIRSENGQIVYAYTHEDRKLEILPAEKVWHVKNMPISSSYNSYAPEGMLGVSPISIARETIGIAMAANEYGGRYFSNNASVGMALKFPAGVKLGENAKNFLKESLAEYGKLENKFKSIILEDGGDLSRIGMSNEDSQFLESRQFQIEEIARIFGVPAILIGHPNNTMTYASAEQLMLAFAVYTIRPWAVRLEQSMNRYLLPEREQGEYFCEFVLDGLLRADTKSRYDAYAVARQWGWMNVDEIRALENLNPLPDGKGKIYLEPMNMIEAGKPNPKITGGNGNA